MSSDDSSNIGDWIGSVVTGFTAASKLPCQAYSVASEKFLSNSTVAGIVDKETNQWLLRVDKGHLKGATYPHININSKLTHTPDPHMEIPAAAIPILGTANSVINTITELLPTIFIGITAGRFGSAMYQDVSEESFPTQTVETGIKIAAETTGGFIGGTVGCKIGSVVGGLVGNTPGAAVGSLLGGLVGGVAGSYTGNGIASNISQETVTEGVRMVGSAAQYATSAAGSATIAGASLAASASSSATDYAARY